VNVSVSVPPTTATAAAPAFLFAFGLNGGSAGVIPEVQTTIQQDPTNVSAGESPANAVASLAAPSEAWYLRYHDQGFDSFQATLPDPVAFVPAAVANPLEGRPLAATSERDIQTPAPIAAGLMTEFHRESLSGLLKDLDQLLIDMGGEVGPLLSRFTVSPWLIAAVATALALEIAHRRRNHKDAQAHKRAWPWNPLCSPPS
jgi:hypothetical protein